MDFRYNLVENQSNNFDDFQNFFLHLEALEKIVNFSNCFILSFGNLYFHSDMHITIGCRIMSDES